MKRIFELFFIFFAQVWTLIQLYLNHQKEIALFFIICQSLLLSFALIIKKMKNNQSHHQGELWARIFTFWWMLTIFGIALTTFKLVLLIVFMLLSLVATAEYAGMLTKQKSFFKILKSGVMPFITASVFICYIILYRFDIKAFLIFQTMFIGLALPCYFVFHFNKSKLMSSLITALMFFCVLLPLGFSLAESNIHLFLLTCFLTEIRDLISYWLGKFLAKLIPSESWLNSKIATDVSPNKTWLTGFLTMLLLIPIFYLMNRFVFININVKPIILFIMSLAIGFIGLMGDLVFSMIKRLHQEKDSGQWLPGGSGIIDRIDSLVFTLPFVYLIFVYL